MEMLPHYEKATWIGTSKYKETRIIANFITICSYFLQETIALSIHGILGKHAAIRFQTMTGWVSHNGGELNLTNCCATKHFKFDKEN